MTESSKHHKVKLWPPKVYFKQLETLRQSIGEDIYIVPLLESKTRLTFSMTGKALTLLDVIEFPKPNPEQNLYPHMLVLSDGSGINLGRILKISKNTVFNPKDSDILYQDKSLQTALMYTPRKLDKDYVHFLSRYALGDILGKKEAYELVNDAHPARSNSERSLNPYPLSASKKTDTQYR